MTKKELGQLIDLKKEIKEIEESILKIEQMDISSAPINVKASKKNFPYVQGHMTVPGYNPALADKRDRLLLERKMLLDARKNKAVNEERKLLQYINNIQESRIRRIMYFRFVEGYTWEEIGKIVHCDRTTAEKMIVRYLDRN